MLMCSNDALSVFDIVEFMKTLMIMDATLQAENEVFLDLAHDMSVHSLMDNVIGWRGGVMDCYMYIYIIAVCS